MNTVPFSLFYDRAAQRKGGESELTALISADIKTAGELENLDDSRYLSAMTNAIFKAGFVWKVVDNKWSNFEEAFWQFNVLRCAMMSPDDVEALSNNAGIIRNIQKINTVPVNATMVLDARKSHGSFSRLVAHWPEDDFIGLLAYLSQQGSRLGGNSAQYFLRAMGKDGFVLGRDGVAAMVNAGVIDRAPSGKGAMKKVQQAYNQWRRESGLGYAQISRTLAMSIDS